MLSHQSKSSRKTYKYSVRAKIINNEISFHFSQNYITMKKNLLFIGLLLLGFSGFSQTTVTWIGGALGDWSDGTQWDLGSEPAAGDLVVINASSHTGDFIRIEGTQNNVPAQIKVTGGKTLTLDLDLTVGNGTDDYHGLQINDLSQINIGVAGGTGRTVTINAPSTKDGVRFNNNLTSADKGKMNIRGGSMLTINSGRDGISSSSSTNDATRIDNEGTINISGVTNNGINLAETLFENNGTVNISVFGQDAIRLGQIDANGNGSSVNAGRFDNYGPLNITIPAGAGSGDRAIDAYGGSTTVGRLRNFNTLTIDEGGNGPQTIGLIGGELRNEAGATLNIGDGRLRIETDDNSVAGKFINEGLFLKDTDSQSGIFIDASGGTATNRAFFKYGSTLGSTILFSNQGGNANGINVNEVQDLGGMLSADLGNVSYSYNHGGAFYGTSDATGLLTLPLSQLDGNQTTTEQLVVVEYPSIAISITNANADAYVTPLPIDLISFDAKLQGRSVMIFWQTASELNNDFVAVEHSEDGILFQEIGRVEGEGDFNTLQNYELEHNNPATGFNYYRLRQVDFDGKMELSDIIQVQVNRTKNEATLNVYPTIATDGIEINIDLADFLDEKINIEIINMNGQVVKTVQGIGGSNLLLSTDNFPDGMFFVKVNGIFPTSQIGRFIKK